MKIQDQSFTDVYDNKHPSVISFMRQALLNVNVETVQKLPSLEGFETVHKFIIGGEVDAAEWDFLKLVTLDVVQRGYQPLTAVDLAQVFPKMTDGVSTNSRSE